jgi:hypothetical protein
MEQLIPQLISVTPMLGFAMFIAYALMKQGASWQEYVKDSDVKWRAYLKEESEKWRSCFDEATCEYKELAERMETAIIENTKALQNTSSTSEFRKELRGLVAELRQELQAG